MKEMLSPLRLNELLDVRCFHEFPLTYRHFNFNHFFRAAFAIRFVVNDV